LRTNAAVRTACSYAPIRFALDWSQFDLDVTNTTKANYFKNVLMPRALNWFSATLQVCPLSGNPYFATKCNSYWTSGVDSGKCAGAMSSSSTTCGPNVVPFQYYQVCFLCCLLCVGAVPPFLLVCMLFPRKSV
jgi:hypothetical protein